jgi:hypothetical protein
MVYVELEKRDKDRKVSKYWKPEKKGDTIEGEIIDFIKKQYDGESRGEVMLLSTDHGDRETPAHQDIQEYQPQLRHGDKIKITCTNIEDRELKRGPRAGDKYQIFTYKVEVDVEEGD